MHIADETLRSRVNAGAAKLDRERPGWHKEINLDVLDISDCYRCILGQLWGFYGDGLNVVLPDLSTPGYEFGFSSEIVLYKTHKHLASTQEDEYRRLTQYWIEAIKSRRAEDQ